MQTNLRILRARADAICAPPERTKRQQQTYDRILAVAPTLLAEASPDILTFANLARVLSVSIGTLRNLFFDFDDLLGVVITTHLETLLEAVTAIPAATQGARRTFPPLRRNRRPHRPRQRPPPPAAPSAFHRSDGYRRLRTGLSGLR